MIHTSLNNLKHFLQMTSECTLSSVTSVSNTRFSADKRVFCESHSEFLSNILMLFLVDVLNLMLHIKQYSISLTDSVILYLEK